ncbi:PKD domain-containing protein [Hymenobacter busanensis]|uniref:PKD domain-containing protein n=1 Tax=Hymenobacter busanensis TaxID=2607656 RepID=A0A7L5A4K3_9BACT|nr:PKD domain-containing protein [Hymenobacter busanensis]KAA9338482.1 PKD domain-containing protein [Hymenobacter busanensis]QHJ09090.1 PKD domain-containing protein [Hymenobacter busanensis]
MNLLLSRPTSGLLFRLPPLVVLTLAGSVAHAQQAGDTLSVACPAPRVPAPCLELNAQRSVDPAAGPLTYRWLMGDGTILTGAVVSHCYATRKRYTVQLDVVDERTGEVRQAEKTLVVDFTLEPLLDFTISSDTVRIGQAVTFDASVAQNPPCYNEVALWDFRDGTVANGRRVTHSFRKAGRFEVRMSLRGNGPGSCPDSHCVSRTVVVRP